MLTSPLRAYWIGASMRGILPAAWPLRQRGHIDPARPRTVELAEEDALPGTEREVAVAERDQHRGRRQRRPHVRGRVLLSLLNVVPAPLVADDPLQRLLEVGADRGVGMLLDDDAGRRVRNVDERCGRAIRAAERIPHLGRHVDELGPAVCRDLELPKHGRVSYATDVGPTRRERPQI